MPKFKTIACTPEGGEQIKVDVSINVGGEFYFNCKELEHSVIDRLRASSRVSVGRSSHGHTHASATTFEALHVAFFEAVNDAYTPEITEEKVIRYIVSSDTCYAENDAGDIRSTAGDGYKWTGDGKSSSGHWDRSKGYRIGVGAAAFTKTTYTYRDGTSKSEFEYYYGKGDHLHARCPASRLNSWNHVGFSRNGDIYGEKIIEIPYTDEAAEFFYEMMYGICKIAQRLDEFIGTPDQLQLAIQNKTQLLIGNK